MTTNDLSQPQPQPIYGQGPRPAHDGMAIAAFVTCWFVPLLGVIFGHISNHKAKVEGRAKDGLATAGVILGYVFSAIYVLAIVLTVTLATMAANTPLPGATG